VNRLLAARRRGHPLVEAIGGNQAPMPLEGRAKRWLLRERLAAR
jgi:hypothetical protein